MLPTDNFIPDCNKFIRCSLLAMVTIMSSCIHTPAFSASDDTLEPIVDFSTTTVPIINEQLGRIVRRVRELEGGVSLTTGVSGILPLANGGTAAALADPGADRILFWDESADSIAFLTAGTGLTITNTTITSDKTHTEYSFKASMNGTVAFSSTGAQKLTMDTEAFDTGSNYDAATNYRFTAPVTGRYIFTAAISAAKDTGGKGIVDFYLYKNGTTATYLTTWINFGDSSYTDAFYVSGSAIISLTANDYVDIYGNMTVDPGTITVQSGSYWSGAILPYN